MKALAIWAMTAWLVSTASAQMISSDPEFVREGPTAYNCTTPLGKQVQCNRWKFPNTGWKRQKVTSRQTVFSKLSDPRAQGVTIETPPSKHVALYDASWADHRDLSVLLPVDYDRAVQELLDRQLRRVQFQQYIEIKESGNYRLHACMAAQFHQDHYELLGIRDGGIQVTLEQFRSGHPDGPLVHMELPKKVTWEYDDNFEIISDGITWVETIDQLPETAPLGEVWGVAEMHSAWVYDGTEWVFIGAPWMDETEVDGYTGHAGLMSAYHTPEWWYDTHDLPATWTCHETEAMLEPGFYALRANVLPTWTYDSGFLYSDHTGFGAISEIGLEKTEPSPMN